jgi:hypothetical protein
MMTLTPRKKVAKVAIKWMLKAYIVWSICADIFLLSGIVYLIFF